MRQFSFKCETLTDIRTFVIRDLLFINNGTTIPGQNEPRARTALLSIKLLAEAGPLNNPVSFNTHENCRHVRKYKTGRVCNRILSHLFRSVELLQELSITDSPPKRI